MPRAHSLRICQVTEGNGDVTTVCQLLRFAGCYPASTMEAKGLTPILNVSDIASTVAWFEKWGWKKLWDWGTPPTFGAVGSGKETCIFLCQGVQGGRGRGANTTTFQQDGDEEGDKGVGMSVWVDDVDMAWEGSRDAHSPSGWPRLPTRLRIRRRFYSLTTG